MEMSENNEMMETGKDDEKVLDKNIPVRRDVGDNTSIVEKMMLDDMIEERAESKVSPSIRRRCECKPESHIKDLMVIWQPPRISG